MRSLVTRKPNILLFFPDQHRGDWTGYRGGPVRTPNLDALAARGQAFTNALTPSPLCSPARGCLAAAKAYDAQSVRHNQHDVDPAEPNIYQALRNAGYTVLGCGKFDLLKHAMDWGEDGRHEGRLRDLGFSGGIDSAGKHDFVTAHARGRPEPFQAFLGEQGLLTAHLDDYADRTGVGNRMYTNTGPTPLPDDAYCDNWIAANGLALLDQAGREPWFLQVNFNGPHEPMDITAAMHERMAGREFPAPHHSTQYTPDAHQAIRACYAAMIENIDDHLGRYLDVLAKRDALDETIIVYASDHGEMLGDHGRWGKVVPYQPSVHIPLVMAGPGIDAKPQCGDWVDLVDLAVTLMDFAGAQPPTGSTGRNLVIGGSDGHKSTGLGTWRAVFHGTMKYVHNFSPDAAARGVAGSFDTDRDAPCLLFDLAEDPWETRNIASSHAAAARRMRDALLAEIEPRR